MWEPFYHYIDWSLPASRQLQPAVRFVKLLNVQHNGPNGPIYRGAIVHNRNGSVIQHNASSTGLQLPNILSMSDISRLLGTISQLPLPAAALVPLFSPQSQLSPQCLMLGQIWDDV